MENANTATNPNQTKRGVSFDLSLKPTVNLDAIRPPLLPRRTPDLQPPQRTVDRPRAWQSSPANSVPVIGLVDADRELTMRDRPKGQERMADVRHLDSVASGPPTRRSSG